MIRRHPILGFRVWAPRAEPLRLVGIIHDVAWPPGDVVATCRVIDGLRTASVGDSHNAPRKECMCGLYAHHALVQAGKDIDGGRGGPGLFGPFSGALPRAPRILGAVVGWGRMVMHTDGWRAQYARPVALAYDDWTPKMVEKLADLYGIPLVAREKLEQVAQEYGEKYEAAECLT